MRDIPGYEGLYAITKDGQVWSYISNKFLKPSGNGNGYLKVNLGRGNQHYIHRLVAMVYIPNPLGLSQVNHKDEDKSNNNVDNLEWVNAKVNANYGTRNQRVSKTKSRAVYCVELDKTYLGAKEAGKSLGVCFTSIRKCCRGTQKTAGGYHWEYYDA